MMNWIAVAIGGAMGACCRYAIALAFAGQATRFPLATFISNGVGCFFMGLGFVLLSQKLQLPEEWRQFFFVGCLGALTTYSTFAMEAITLFQSDQFRLAALYVVATLVLSLSSVSFGMQIGKSLLL